MNANTKKSIQKTVNKVREQATQGYQDNVPVLNDNNLASFKEAFFAYQPAINEFYVGLVNLFAKIIWNTDRFNHKLSFLKKGNYTIGYDIEEIHTNPVNPALYDNTDGAGILGDYPPEVLEYVREKRRQPFVGQEQEYFLCRLHADATEPVLDDREFCDYKWIAPAEFKLEWLPEFKKKVYARVLEDFFNVRARDK